ncbi:MAG: Maf family protein [candidate division KSB1 bacterium]|jgi:septum formation protein|nr:Maf family protein [candidate division KSB1 bacterium]
MPLLESNSRQIILASKSPRRIELLKKIIDKFEVHVSDIDESLEINDPVDFVIRLSKDKVREVAARFAEGILIGADSIVVLDDKILNKPADRDDAAHMLRMLSGREHSVYTGFTILSKPGNSSVSDYDMTRVKFRHIEDWEIDKYIDVAQPFDKAGSYGIQDESAVFVEYIQGCFYNVMGLPVAKVYRTLAEIMKKE